MYRKYIFFKLSTKTKYSAYTTYIIRVFDVYYPWLPKLMLHLTSHYLYRFTNYNNAVINIEMDNIFCPYI